jgi:hypothetical protein
MRVSAVWIACELSLREQGFFFVSTEQGNERRKAIAIAIYASPGGENKALYNPRCVVESNKF